LLLKKKKFYENNLQNTDNQLDNIDQMVTGLEFKQMEIQVVQNMKIGNDCLKKLNEMMSLDEIEDIMDDTREAMEHQKVGDSSFFYT
jgi:charged multivesicular body protein 6